MFTVPVIPPDLRHEETIIQAAHALCCLEKTIFSIFDRIDQRIKKNDAKIESIVVRVSRAQEKVKGLVGTKKSIKIYAPSRFPATNILRNDTPLTFASTLESMAEAKQRDEMADYEVKSRVDPPTPHAHKEKLVFFHVRAGDPRQPSTDLATARSLLNQQHGLGRVPANVTSVSSTLRFDTDEFVYDAETGDVAEAWKQAKLFKKQRRQMPQGHMLSNQRLSIAPAPHSLTHRDQRAALAGSLRYTPRLSEVPDLNLPLDLPDLPGIADDIQFEVQEQQFIAPSLFIENLPDLAELEQQHKLAKEPEPIAEPLMFKNEERRPSKPLTQADTADSSAKISLAAMPPPPPPPPPPVLPPVLPPNTRASPLPILPPMPMSDKRSDLMAAIRNVGGVEGARLRPAAAAPIDAVDSRSSEANANSDSELKTTSKSSGGGLMAELHSKLMLRRKGISGAKDKESSGNSAPSNSGSNPLFSNLSSLIPQTTTTGKHTSGDDDNEEEANDWGE